jgi:hypothetical protein
LLYAFEFESLTPNPSNEASALIYNLSNPGLTNIALYDIYGKKVKDILNSEQQGIGRFKTYFDTYDLAEGVYLCQLNVNGATLSKKISGYQRIAFVHFLLWSVFRHRLVLSYIPL